MTRASVPETTVDKHCEPEATDDGVGATGKGPDVARVRDAAGTECGAERELGLRT